MCSSDELIRGDDFLGGIDSTVNVEGSNRYDRAFSDVTPKYVKTVDNIVYYEAVSKSGSVYNVEFQLDPSAYNALTSDIDFATGFNIDDAKRILQLLVNSHYIKVNCTCVDFAFKFFPKARGVYALYDNNSIYDNWVAKQAEKKAAGVESRPRKASVPTTDLCCKHIYACLVDMVLNAKSILKNFN